MRKVGFAVGEVYHIFTKSIAGFKIFNKNEEYLRMKEQFSYYQKEKPVNSFSEYTKHKDVKQWRTSILDEEKIIDIIAYCIMPTHLHLILKQLKDDGISIFMKNILNSYTRHFNLTHDRKGPLWEGRFKNVLVKTDEQLLHLTRYIHLNPVTAFLVNKPEDWMASSYCEYTGQVKKGDRICNYDKILEIEPVSYREFVEDRISYQRELAKVKHLILE